MEKLLPDVVDVLSGLTPELIGPYLDELSPDDMAKCLDNWDMWAMPYQKLPAGNWRRWVFRAGRSTGKTYTGAKWTHEVARDRDKVRDGEIALVGRAWNDAVNVMIEGPSGLLKTAPRDFTPDWSPGKGLLVWPNGVRGHLFAAGSPASLRGPNLSWVWADEVEHWTKNEHVWHRSIEFALRKGWARALLTSTPIKGSKLLRNLETKDSTVVTRASTRDNPFLDADVKRGYYEDFDGTRIGREELDGDIIDTVDGALFFLEQFDKLRVKTHPPAVRALVSVDPAVSDTEVSAEHGITAMVKGDNGHGYLVKDRSRKGSPAQWAGVAISMYRQLRADAIVAEVNNGGDMVEHTIRSLDPTVKVIKVHASRGKMIRAEPVAALVERGKIHHVGVFPECEEQLCTREPGDTEGFDRFDSYVWGFSELLLSKKKAGPLSAYT